MVSVFWFRLLYRLGRWRCHAAPLTLRGGEGGVVIVSPGGIFCPRVGARARCRGRGANTITVHYICKLVMA